MITKQQPPAFAPAYNDNYIEFESTFNSDDRAVITIEDYKFTIYPKNNSYLFNLKEVVKGLITKEFKDSISIGSSWGYSDPSLFKRITVHIEVFGDNTSVEQTLNLTFNLAVRQFGDRDYDNDYQLLLPSDDGLNYYLTYWEGFPIDIPFRYVNSSDNLTIENQRTQQVSSSFTPTSTNPYRLFIDKGSSNWHTAGILDLPDMMSRLYIRENGERKTVIELTKKANQCGVYLKWFNQYGGYSYFLFNQWYREDYNSGVIDTISTNNYSNIYNNHECNTKITGRSGNVIMNLKTVVSNHENEHLKSLLFSPHVQMYSEQDPYQSGYWIDVKVATNSYSYYNKRTRNHVDIAIELEQNTQIL